MTSPTPEERAALRECDAQDVEFDLSPERVLYWFNRLLDALEAAEARSYREDGRDVYWVHEAKAIRIDAALDLNWSECESCGVSWPGQQMYNVLDDGMVCPACYAPDAEGGRDASR